VTRGDDIKARIEERREDADFQRRLQESHERNRETLKLLAEGDAKQEDV
jgi:hypothetical protein